MSKHINPLEKLDELYSKAREIMSQKNHDYRGGSDDPYANFRGSTSLGIDPVLGILLRIQDKMMRIKTFSESGTLKAKGESVEDAFIDVINYIALIAGIIHDGVKMSDAQSGL